MKTFFYILQKVIGSKEIIYPDEPRRSFTFDPNFIVAVTDTNIQHMNDLLYIHNIIYNIHKYFKYDTNIIWADLIDVGDIYKISRAKYMSLNEMLANIFMSDTLKDKIFTIFSKSQKTYHALSKFAKIYRYKKYPIVCSDDLSTLSPIDASKPNSFTLLQKGSKYLFNLNELVRIIETSLAHTIEFFADPQSPKNPYNNLVLTSTDLYNIYFKLKGSNRTMSIIFHLFFKHNFCLHKFKINEEAFLRSYSIKKYVMNSPYTLLHDFVQEMIEDNIYTKRLDIDPDFPKEVLVSIFRPFLYLYFLINYDIKNTSKYPLCICLLSFKLQKFYLFNRSFGRKYIKVNNVDGKRVHTYNYNTKHKTFNELPDMIINAERIYIN